MEILEIIRVGYIRSVYFQVQPINKLVEFTYVIVFSYFAIWNIIWTFSFTDHFPYQLLQDFGHQQERGLVNSQELGFSVAMFDSWADGWWVVILPQRAGFPSSVHIIFHLKLRFYKKLKEPSLKSIGPNETGCHMPKP